MLTIKPGLSVTTEFHGLDPPPGTPIPTVPELLDYCTAVHPENHHYAMGLPYPKEAPVFWIKYGSFQWNGVIAQDMAYHGLRKINSPVRAPGVFYSCILTDHTHELYTHKTYLVMEYIPGSTAAQLLEIAKDSAEETEAIYRKVAFAIHELSRIPIPLDSRPAAIDGDVIWHSLFDERAAPRHYQNVEQLEQHLNLV